MSDMWRPTATLATLKARAAMYSSIREFLSSRGVLEVETPLLCQSTAMDPFLDSFPLEGKRYLQTSPEFPMKRLLAAGSGAIFQISKAFRQGERSRRHNPEFTLLEWYQPGYSLSDLQAELLALVGELMDVFETEHALDKVPQCFSYADIFESVVGLDPHSCGTDELASAAKRHIDIVGDDITRDSWLDLLMSHMVEPEMPAGLCVVTDFPLGQAALAEVETDQKGRLVAKRLELYIGGMELANGYQELIDSKEQMRRFEADNNQRQSLGKDVLPLPMHLIDALAEGMPATSGIAVGLDRLLMVLMTKDSVADVVSFPWDRA
ncbi:EF-P lysine aminoacylase GenX [Gammaproteobacteria bacterium 45_16_T64]|nr:EF-P lysine aminoacylase GenX [Gammaproteobacteria bacterium 45_16_T64]